VIVWRSQLRIGSGLSNSNIQTAPQIPNTSQRHPRRCCHSVNRTPYANAQAWILEFVVLRSHFDKNLSRSRELRVTKWPAALEGGWEQKICQPALETVLLRTSSDTPSLSIVAYGLGTGDDVSMV
jgi:hypothetical protein